SIKSFYKYLTVNAKICDNNPANNIETPRIPKSLPKYLTLDESVNFLDTVKKYGKENEERDTAIFTMFLNCGMRLSELCGISLSDLTPDLEKVVITGKGSKQRTLYLNDSCRAALTRWLKVRKGLRCKDQDALWVSRNGNRLTARAVQYNMNKYLLAAGLTYRQLSVHKLRHTAATLLYGTGKVDVRVLKDILGHEQLNTTQIYTHVTNGQMKSAMELNPLSASAPERDEEKESETN
ncbi:MAG: tyrosine-type recombinase/integrase, partial [Clostridia bacterium]|nr:tyrosine-type recombinase/integrase [Clostridia bacterium]